MKSAHPKVLHALAGRPMLAHVLAVAEQLAPERIVVVVGPGMDAVAAAARPHDVVVQDERLGTGHAVGCARPLLAPGQGDDDDFDLLVIYGDTPLLRLETLERMLARREGPDAPAIVGMAFRPDDPGRYGRVILDSGDRVQRIVEFVDAGPAERAVELCNAGMMIADGRQLFSWIEALDNDNAKGEFYLTDVYGLAGAEGAAAVMVEAPEEDVQGVNDRRELAMAEAVVQRRLRDRAMAAGTTLIDPDSVWLSWDTQLGSDVVVQPGVFFGPGVTVEEGAEIRAFSHLEGVRIGPGALVGPFARLRPGTVLEQDARVGNFVEAKNVRLGRGAKANHLTYLGDAEVGAKANIGAGTITCNYDGFAKHRTEIGAGAFIGSNTALVAPVKVGEQAIVGAGSTVTRDVADDALAVARGRQSCLEGGARKFRAKHRSSKASKE